MFHEEKDSLIVDFVDTSTVEAAACAAPVYTTEYDFVLKQV